MEGSAPLELHQLFRAHDIANREAAWEKLIERHTRLLMAVARSFGSDHDSVMERYSFILEKLRDADFRRLRSYDAAAGASFPTWLTVTARHLCLDLHRSKYGRTRSEHQSDDSTAVRAMRRALSDLTEGDTPPDSLPDPASESVDAAAMRGNLDDCLKDALARLTPTQRLIITLGFEDDLPASRIARIVGLATPFHVYRQLSAVLNQMRATLQARGIDGPDG